MAIKTDTQVLGGDSGINAGLASTYADLNQPSDAIKYYKDAINGIEQVRRNIQGLPPQLQASFLQATVNFDKVKTVDIYTRLADLLFSQGRVQEAQQVLELVKIRELRDYTTQARKNSIMALGLQISECDRTNCPTKAELNDQLTAMGSDYDKDLNTIEKQIRERVAVDDGTFDPRKLGKAKNIVEAQPGTVLIYPFVLEDKIWLLLTAPGGVAKTFKVNVGREELVKTAKEFRQSIEECEQRTCTSADTTKSQAVSQKLYNWLIKPLEPELQANPVKNLVFALDRGTRYIPMSALYDGKQYLIEKYNTYNVLSADLTDVSQTGLPLLPENSPVLAMGVSQAVANFPPLPNVTDEINNIVKNPTKTQGIYAGKEFLNSTFDFRTLRDNLTGNKILHLATHGEFVPNSKDESYLLLGNGEKLTLSRINTLTELNNIHLVVLSACQSALADTRQDGVEISSVAYHFLNRGAKAVMASLWLVNDKSTSLLMQEFYKNLASGKMTKSEALRQAQLSLLHTQDSKALNAGDRGLTVAAEPGKSPRNQGRNSDFSHPYYWAPFILIGNGL